MPKEGRNMSTNNHRHAPYPQVSTTMSNPSYSSIAPGTDRHASQSWPPENDRKLMEARKQGMNWQPIATKYFPDKTANACRKRHERLMEKRNNTETWQGVKMEDLAKAYNDLREEMWKILAERVGEKWETVEQKCMEKGYKTLITTGRSAIRREQSRPQGSFPSSDLDEDLPNNHSPMSHRSRSHQSDEIRSFNDSGLGGDPSIHDENTYSASSTTLPPFSPHRTLSITSSTVYTPTIAATPYPPSASLQQSPPLQQQHNLPPSFSQQQQQPQTLPSFSTAFGMPGISSVMNPSHHQRGAAVTSHC